MDDGGASALATCVQHDRRLVPQEEMFDTMPVFHFIPAHNFEHNKKDFAWPLYKAAERKGVLTTTCTSSNYILDLDFPQTSRTPATTGCCKSVAALCALAD